MMTDYYLLRKQRLEPDDLYNFKAGRYHFGNGWNDAALMAFGCAAVFSVATVWVPVLGVLSGYAWLIGAALGGLIYLRLARGKLEV